MSLEHIDAERILDLISGTIDGGWNDGIEAFVGASNDGEFLSVEVEDDDGTKKRFTLTIEEL
ncbi:hypothetical protein SEA_TRIBUTE_130 [Streptomyces phage Tribute]|jgi:hypothetical protein|uniref:Tudor domain-containing protein n=4 Tax=Samistivirus peebs TaxID=2560790 RepID=A0A5Q2WG15_9CAUD|nr:hypothetical protein FDI38_gp144 [Streptomyces phage Peebs]QAX95855.1 hypothetical protein SEA_TEUTSCH_130 [Streptomyces phage Teutsch]QGH78310.1 hypothetical protein SEA_TRIBUTE_130 [Streptomyces phage Tribute]QRI46112.1 hypothetical protein SEA_CROSS_131 [Streptomyces phage Cross]WDS51916.1 hypothetical protein SEA_PEPPERWOOD_130 [Streptomyces phage Pepperwood]WNN95481.1 hypothetical protein SEA_WATERMOORE_130 [Streptomyces phage Watermoore]